ALAGGGAGGGGRVLGGLGSRITMAAPELGTVGYRPGAEVGVMAEPHTTGPVRGAAAPRDVLVATKFHVPRAGLVPRPGLLARLTQGVGRGLAGVCTPAGYGKTALPGGRARRRRRPGGGVWGGVVVGGCW